MPIRRCSGLSTRNSPPRLQNAWPPRRLLALLVEQQHPLAGVGDLGGGGQPGQAGAHDDDVGVPRGVRLHVGIVGSGPGPGQDISLTLLAPGLSGDDNVRVRERQRVHQLIRDDLDRVVPDVVATIREQIPAYRTLSPDQVEEVSAIAAWATSRILRAVGRGRRAGPGRRAAVPRHRRRPRARRPTAAGHPARLPGRRHPHHRPGRRDRRRPAHRRRRARAGTPVDGQHRHPVRGAVRRALGGQRAAQRGPRARARRPARRPAQRAPGDAHRAAGPVPRARRHAAGPPARARHHDRACRLRTPSSPASGAGPPSPSSAPTGEPGPGPGCLVEATDTGDVPRAHRLAELAAATAPGRAFAVRPVLDEADAQVVALLAAHRDADPVRLAALVLGRVTDQRPPPRGARGLPGRRLGDGGGRAARRTRPDDAAPAAAPGAPHRPGPAPPVGPVRPRGRGLGADQPTIWSPVMR